MTPHAQTPSFSPLLVFGLVLISLCSCRSITGPRIAVAPHLERAEQMSNEGDFEGAIAEYQLHMQERLRDSRRPDWENPHFYLLLIGDLQLAQGRVDQAEQSFLDAEKAGIEESIVNDRLRTLAIYFEKHRKYREALDVLEKYRSRDPLLFEGMADRIAKRLAFGDDSPTVE